MTGSLDYSEKSEFPRRELQKINHLQMQNNLVEESLAHNQDPSQVNQRNPLQNLKNGELKRLQTNLPLLRAACPIVNLPQNL